MNEWMDGWMDGRMDGWMNESSIDHICSYTSNLIVSFFSTSVFCANNKTLSTENVPSFIE